MGVDTEIILPAYVRVEDVASVIGMLVGLPHSMRSNPIALEVEGIGVTPAGMPLPNCAYIGWKGGPLRPIDRGHWMYHFETRTGERLIMPRATAGAIAIGLGLVEFFGGRLIYSDHDDKSHVVPLPRTTSPEDNEEWDVYQRAMAAVRPLHQSDLDACQQWSAYPGHFE